MTMPMAMCGMHWIPYTPGTLKVCSNGWFSLLLKGSAPVGSRPATLAALCPLWLGRKRTLSPGAMRKWSGS
ncbi:hypothetical protein D3C75_1181150 [compost metagenome]